MTPRLAWLLGSAVVLAAGASLPAQVTSERIVRAVAEPENWLTYSGDVSSRRHSPLTQITAANVGALHVKWAYQMDSRAEVSPIVVDGVMYVSGPNTAAALDVHTGRELWSWKRPIPTC